MMRRFHALYLAALCGWAAFGKAAAEPAHTPASTLQNAMTCLEVVGNALPKAELEASL